MGIYINGIIYRVIKIRGKNDHFVVVDKHIKYAHFFGIQITLYTASQVVKAFIKEFHRLIGFPKVILTNKDHKFIGMFWK